MKLKKYELIRKSREAMLSAVQIYNNPQVLFKSETYIALAVIAWTYMLHAYYGNYGIDCRYFSMANNRKKFDRTKHGAYKYWELERCLDEDECPLDAATIQNLKFLIGIRHEIEHQMTKQIDDSISAKVQSCSINFNYYMKQLFGSPFGVDQELSLAIQFAPVEAEQKEALYRNNKLSGNIKRFITSFESDLTPDEIGNTHYAYRVVFARVDGKRINGETDEVVRFLPYDSPEAKDLNATLTLIKEKEKKKYLSSQIVAMMKAEGYEWFTMGELTAAWKQLGGRAQYGIQITKTMWMWYENWLTVIRQYCVQEDPKRKEDASPDSLLPNVVVSIIREKGFSRFNSTWLNEWERENSIDRNEKANGHFGKGGKYFWNRAIIDSVEQFCIERSLRLR